jgi:hypothetical protein
MSVKLTRITTGQGGDNLHVFGIAPDGTCYLNWQKSPWKWSGWQKNWHSAPKLTRITTGQGGGNLHVFGIAPDGTCYLNWRSTSTRQWSGWQENWQDAPKFTRITTGQGGGNLHVFGIAPDGTCYLNWRQSSGQWSGWLKDWQDAPKLTRMATGQANGNLHVFGIAPDGTCYLNWRQSSGQWSGWLKDWQDAPKLTRITTGQAGRHLHVFGIAPDGTCYLNWRQPSGQWSGWLKDWQDTPKLTYLTTEHSVSNLQNIFGLAPDLHVFGIALDGTCHLNERQLRREWSGWRKNWHKNVHPSNWMEDLAEEIGDQALKNVALPGTHNSGTHAISPLSGFSPSTNFEPWMDAIYALGITGISIKTILAGWAKTQDKDIRQQLEAGIRYFDLRVCRRHDNESYIVHGLYGQHIDSVIDAVHQFLTEHNKEIVILDFHKLYEMTEASHEALVGKLIKTFGNTLVPRARGNDVTVNELLASNQRVLVFYDDTRIVESHPQLWPKSSLHRKWHQSTDLNDLKSKIEKYLPNERHQFFVLEGVLTPDGKMIGKGLVPFSKNPSSIKSLAEKTNPSIVGWIDYLWRDQNLNIVMVDWFHETALVDVIISINQEK